MSYHPKTIVKTKNVALAVLALSLSAAGAAATGPAPKMTMPKMTAPTAATFENGSFRMRVVATGFEMPWELSVGPDGMLWVTERLGKRVVRVNPQTGRKQVALTIPEILAGGQHQGLLGMAFHPDLLRGKGHDWVYLAYTYGDKQNVRKKIVRYTFNRASGTLADPQTVLDNLPGGEDHNAGRLKFGPDSKLYFLMGDLGHNQQAHACEPITAQVLPTAAEIAAHDWTNYTGKTLRLNLDGSIPSDNPVVGGVRSHLYTVGHRNPQGLTFGQNGLLYAAEQGPSSDDEVNILRPGGNYGWPNIAGYQDNQAYTYANWSAAPNCAGLKWSATKAAPGVPTMRETDFSAPNLHPPLMTLWTVPSNHDFDDQGCGKMANLCNPTAAPASIDLYEKTFKGIPAWQNSLLVSSLKEGALYRIPLSPSGQNTRGEAIKVLATNNRYRDTAISPDTRTIYVITDSGGNILSQQGQGTSDLANPGAILAFTYTGR